MSDIFDQVLELPDPDKDRQFEELVGLDDVKSRLVKEGRLLLRPAAIEEWSKKYHGTLLPAAQKFQDRPPLIILSGDVGTGKTTLANSFGSAIARENRIQIQLMRLGLNTRGSGAVGEMTKLITAAFNEVERLAKTGVGPKGATSAIIMVIDEADALAQSRELDQMHHEDRAGVNALIRGIDRFTSARLPALIVMCTNRAGSIDPAVLRRAAAHFTFVRPTPEQIAAILQSAFEGILKGHSAERLAEMAGPARGRPYGYTFSDLTQRLIPAVILKAFPDQPITETLIASTIREVPPTKPFAKE
jgi:SpoVK/Ycf46/Vps4 family AAA+-type ATPase